MARLTALLPLLLASAPLVYGVELETCSMHTLAHSACSHSNVYNTSVEASANDCCARCSAEPQCVQWTWHAKKKNCPRTSATEGPTHSKGATCGTRGTPSPPPPPSPTPSPGPPPAPGSKPNIILFLTDDQDYMLGGWDPMRQATKALSEKGSTAQNWFIHTPICCPSRAELLTGRYFHNVKSKDGSGCMHVDEDKVNPNTLAKYLNEAGYAVGMFGKYLNSCPKEMQPGFTKWFANGGGAYFAPTFYTNNGTWKGTKEDYSTSVIGNKSIEWIEEIAKTGQPWMAYIGTKAPHGPAQPAPWYADAFPGLQAPRNPSFNYHAVDHHATISKLEDMFNTSKHGNIVPMVDDVYRRRHQTLLSVDDLVAAVVAKVEALGIADNTYMFYTSDHGYQNGELRLPCDKRNVYDFDLRIPMVIRGPGIKENSKFDFIASNVDVAPTMLAMAGASEPADGLDGRSVLHLLIDPSVPLTQLPLSVATSLAKASTHTTPWRDSLLIEYYHVVSNGGCGMIYNWPVDDTDNNFIALRVQNKEFGNMLYAEFQSGKHIVDFSAPNFYEVFDLDADPWQLHNIYNSTAPDVLQKLHTQLHKLYTCKGASCDPETHSESAVGYV